MTTLGAIATAAALGTGEPAQGPGDGVSAWPEVHGAMIPAPFVEVVDEATELGALAEAAQETETDAAFADEPGPEPEQPKRWIRHRAAPRETVTQLSLRYRVSPDKIREWSKLDANAEEIKPGKRLRIYSSTAPPQRVRMTHTVAEGDTWVSIARAHGANSTDMRMYNYRTVGRELQVGEELVIWADPTIRAAVEADTLPEGIPPSVRPGGFSIGPPHRGRLINGVRIPANNEGVYELRYPNSAWGTTLAVRSSVLALHDFRARSGYTGDIKVGTMSRQRGGHIGGHRSHQSGRDLDIRLPIRSTLPQRLKPRPRRVDWMALWHLIRAFDDTGNVKVIFLDYLTQRRLYRVVKKAGVDPALIKKTLQYPHGWASTMSVVRHSSGHNRHIHVRFWCAEWETECVH